MTEYHHVTRRYFYCNMCTNLRGVQCPTGKLEESSVDDITCNLIQTDNSDGDEYPTTHLPGQCY